MLNTHMDSIVPADILAPNSAGPSTGTVQVS